MGKLLNYLGESKILKRIADVLNVRDVKVDGVSVVDNNGDANIPATTQIQSDWTQADTTKPDYIKNKPSIPSGQIQSDWSQTDNTQVDYIKNKPTIPDPQIQSDWNQTTTTAKDYIKNKPTIPTVNNKTITIQKNGTDVNSFTLNQSTDKSINITMSKSDVGLDNVPNVTTNNQTPTFTQASTRANIASGEKLSVIFGKIMKFFADLKTVAFTGSYNDLSNKPTIPAAQVNSDWNASSGVAEILNKPTLATVATSGSYNDLSNKPTIPTVNNATLTIQKNGTTVKTFTANASSNVTCNITVPTKTSDITNDSNYVSDASYVHTDNNYTSAEKTKLSGIATGAEVNVQSDWNVTDTSDDSFIKNKPTIPTVYNSAFYGKCESNGDAATKVVDLVDATGWQLRRGVIVGVWFRNKNTASSVTLNVNGSGNIGIFFNTGQYTGTQEFITGSANRIIHYMYNGAYWVFINISNNWRDTDTHRPINVNGTQLLGNNNNTAVNFKNGTNTTVTGSGSNIQINATDTNTTYTFAEGSTNGAFSVTPSGGSAQSVAIHGLGDRAYDSTDYLPLAGGTLSNSNKGPQLQLKNTTLDFKANNLGVSADVWPNGTIFQDKNGLNAGWVGSVARYNSTDSSCAMEMRMCASMYNKAGTERYQNVIVTKVDRAGNQSYDVSNPAKFREAIGVDYGVVSKTADGLVPQLPNETTTDKFLRQDGTWNTPLKVRQTLREDTASTTYDENHPLLMAVDKNTQTGVNRYGVVYRNNSIYANPHTGGIYAKQLAVGDTSTVGTIKVYGSHTLTSATLQTDSLFIGVNSTITLPTDSGKLALTSQLPTYTDITVNTDNNGFANIVSDAVPEKTISAFVLSPARASCELWLNYVQEHANYEGGYRAYVYTRGPSPSAVAGQSVTIRLWKMP